MTGRFFFFNIDSFFLLILFNVNVVILADSHSLNFTFLLPNSDLILTYFEVMLSYKLILFSVNQLSATLHKSTHAYMNAYAFMHNYVCYCEPNSN